jgi:hypothetical protein
MGTTAVSGQLARVRVAVVGLQPPGAGGGPASLQSSRPPQALAVGLGRDEVVHKQVVDFI